MGANLTNCQLRNVADTECLRIADSGFVPGFKSTSMESVSRIIRGGGAKARLYTVIESLTTSKAGAKVDSVGK